VSWSVASGLVVAISRVMKSCACIGEPLGIWLLLLHSGLGQPLKGIDGNPHDLPPSLKPMAEFSVNLNPAVE
jgi:hypothetical protein